jgi:phosphoenolpyruvate carboxylase
MYNHVNTITTALSIQLFKHVLYFTTVDRSITDTLRRLDRPDLHPYERKECLTQLRRVIAGLWGTNEIRLTKPTPQQEAAGGIAIIESVLWDAVPAYLRKLDAQCRASLGAQLPIDGAAGPPITFGSWIGGDRDGNPNVTPAVTEEVVMHQRLRAAKLLLADLTALYNDLAISSRFSSEMQTLADSIPHSSDKFELYRRVIGHLRQRLVCTIKECETAFATYSTIDANEPTTTPGSSNPNPSTAVDEGSAAAVVTPIYKAAELLEPLTIMYHSLQETGLDLVADGLLVDTIRRLQVFGMTLVPLDVREESTLHTNALDAITQWIGVEEGSSYREWDEPKRLAWLTKELSGNRPLFRTRDIDTIPAFDASVKKTLKTFLTLSGQEPEALGAYVISQAQTASDVLAVKLLQQQFGMTAAKGNSMRVSPLFETLDDLVNAPEVLDTLMSIPVYTNMIHSKQEIMVGYSDSAKDAGRLAANWALYESQEKMIQVAMAHGVELTFFHGKGGTVGRGGNPALYRAILSHPPNTINGRFRVTEQGEMITQNFGSPNIAERTLDIYTAAVLNEKFTQHVLPTDEWRTEMERMSAVSCEDYRFLVREEPRFVPYFRQATPELELGSLNIGSRPAKRNPKGGIESLRAIPWTFAWTQTRLHLSSWLGVGKGLSPDECSEESATRMKNMYKQWPWFAENVDLITMILSKTDYSISQNYDEQLVDRTPELIGLGDDVRRKLEQTRMAVLAVQESDDYQGEHVTITRASNKIRNPYVDPLNIVQAELLKRLRAMEKEEGAGADAPASLEKKHLQNALIVSINGISQGMRNSG